MPLDYSNFGRLGNMGTDNAGASELENVKSEIKHVFQNVGNEVARPDRIVPDIAGTLNVGYLADYSFKEIMDVFFRIDRAGGNDFYKSLRRQVIDWLDTPAGERKYETPLSEVQFVAVFDNL